VKNEIDNSIEEERCLQKFKDIIKVRKNTLNSVKAVIVEPISFLGNHFATPTFY